MKVRLPRIFISDRIDRCLDCGKVTIHANAAIVECDAATLEDIRQDAEYQGWYTDNGPENVVASARRTFKQLTAMKVAREVC